MFGVRLRDERGVTATIVAVTLVVLFGMLALAVDLGFMTVKRRAMVRSSDAAALAFAESCTRSGLGTPDQQADALAVANVSDAVRLGPAAWPYQGVCLPGASLNWGTVTVTYQGPSGVFFGRILGVTDERVQASSTAVWGPAVAAGGVAPFMLSTGRLSNPDCWGIPNAAPGTHCWFYWNDKDIGNAQWGILNIQGDPTLPNWGWNVSPSYNCPSLNSGTLQAMMANAPPYLPMGNPDTYVCTRPGGPTDVWTQLKAFASLPETDPNKTRLFPINDSTKQVDRSGNLCPAPCDAVDKYDVIGFAALKVEGAFRGNEKDWPAECAALAPKKAKTNDANAWCLHAVWVDYFFQSGPPCPNCDPVHQEAVSLMQ